MILYSVDGHIATITLDRPEKRNAFNAEFVGRLREAVDRAAEDPAVRVVLLRANGEAFSAGADLGYLQSLQSYSYEENLADSTVLAELYQRIYTHPKVFIAMVQGHAIAGGCGLATVCDFCFAVPKAVFGYTEVKIGFVPAIVSVFLVRKIGEAKARELLLTGKLMSAQIAKDYGLINRVLEWEQVLMEAYALADEIVTSTSGESLRLTKQLLARLPGLDTPEAFRFAAEQNAQARMTDDCKRGIASFLNKETLNWGDR
jgi:methylglutaconyl-CoA hydratase